MERRGERGRRVINCGWEGAVTSGRLMTVCGLSGGAGAESLDQLGGGPDTPPPAWTVQHDSKPSSHCG